MTDLRTAAQMALDWNENHGEVVFAGGGMDAVNAMNKVSEALRAALAQGEQQPVACIVKGCRNHKHEGHFVGDLCGPCHTFITAGEGKYSQAYRNAQREWQGLTDEEVGLVSDEFLEGVLWAEAKLKEKNI